MGKNLFLRAALGLVAFALLALAQAFSLERMQADLQALLAQGPRVAGTPAVAAGEYLAAELRKVGYTVEFFPFTYNRTHDQGSSLQVGGVSFPVSSVAGSPGRRVEGPLVVVPGAGLAADFANLNLQNSIVVVRRGGIPGLQKARLAAQQGALGVILVTEEPSGTRFSFGGHSPIPGVTISSSDGEALFGLTGSRAVLDARIVTEEVQGRNLIARRNSQNPLAIVGAHYDSVPGSPGANDNASGTVTVLELARQLANSPLSERVWFMFFDGEEDGLWGSRRFVEQNPELVRGLKAMLNLDMVGVDVNGSLGIGGSQELRALADCNALQVACGSAPGGGSDHVPFAQAGVPVLFFFRGLDPNYHRPTDTVADPVLMAQTGRLVQGILQRLLR
ncbi:MAG: M28 family metallopeptidase [Meiothermus sp.]|uniref:M28 family metallopeptidase n=1 Tax=Meiothermus sp. TaxID=1955249 RepID=UPI0028CEE2D1|nr:M28 family metallopeptidase [Meiothermus sp.]MDT7920111.1 M28 family metallopeptidase [Meiothermus sp.]